MINENMEIGTEESPQLQFDGMKTILFYFEFLIKWRYLILVIFFGTVFTMLIRLLFFVTFYYETRVTMLPSTPQNKVSSFSMVSSFLGAPMKSDNTYEVFYSEILKSRRISDVLLKKTFYSRRFAKDMELLDIFEVPIAKEKVRLQMGYDILSGLIEVDYDKDNALTTLTVESPDPKLSVDLANELVKELEIYIRSLDNQKSKAKRIFIEGRIDDTKLLLKSTEEEIKNFRENNRRIEKSPQLQLEEGRMIRELRVQEEVYLTLKKEFETVKIEEIKKLSPITILDEPIEPLSKSRPKRGLIMVLTIIAAGIFSIATAGIIEYSRIVMSNSEHKSRLSNLFIELKNDFIRIRNVFKRPEQSEDDNI